MCIAFVRNTMGLGILRGANVELLSCNNQVCLGEVQRAVLLLMKMSVQYKVFLM